MKDKFENDEFMALIKRTLEIKEFHETKNISHHGITRFEHSIRVAYFSYKITKFLRLNYKETTEAAMLHDFFFDNDIKETKFKKLIHHPTYAVENANKYISLTERQKDIIKTHMFPVTLNPPKYLESWIVDLVDDVAAIYEKIYSVREELSTVGTFFFILAINILKIR